jgi:hypothetical protein
MNELQIDLTPEVLDEGPDYERVAFGLLEIKVAGHLLTAGIGIKGEGRHYYGGPYVSGYHLVEWLVWNWWRLRWEPRFPSGVSSFDWKMAHCMPAVGEGYFWPNITISSDGFQCDLISERSDPSDTPFFHYIGAPPVTVTAADFESAVDRFILEVLQRLDHQRIAGTNLQKLWDDLRAERNDPEAARYRRVEALLGFDPDQAADVLIEKTLKDAEVLGENALEELATGAADHMVSARQITDTMRWSGYDMNLDDAFRLHRPAPVPWGRSPAWHIGVAAANAVRQQAGQAGQPLSDSRLAEFAGMPSEIITSDLCTNSLSWIFRSSRDSAHVALRSRWNTGRRFDVARLIGDRLFSECKFTPIEPLAPATRSYSYRQKAQRAFAAELLSPWEMVKAMLGNDYSTENQEMVAEHFAVSPMTISASLANNAGIGREYLIEWASG